MSYARRLLEKLHKLQEQSGSIIDRDVFDNTTDRHRQSPHNMPLYNPGNIDPTRDTPEANKDYMDKEGEYLRKSGLASPDKSPNFQSGKIGSGPDPDFPNSSVPERIRYFRAVDKMNLS